ncbi:hypothetical protein DFH09DRAFT_1334819 [Mycena vulgaris]|nr:hypothetical protein DFH09DRAFT_1334819 [Mycena vulgaris]
MQPVSFLDYRCIVMPMSGSRPSATGVGIGSESGDEESRVSYRVDPNLPRVAGSSAHACLSTELPRFTAPCKADPCFTDVCAPRTPSASDAYAVGRGSAPCLALRRSHPRRSPPPIQRQGRRPPPGSASTVVSSRPRVRVSSPSPRGAPSPCPQSSYASPVDSGRSSIPHHPLIKVGGQPSTVSSSRFPRDMHVLLPMPKPLPPPLRVHVNVEATRIPAPRAPWPAPVALHLLLAPVERAPHPLRTGVVNYRIRAKELMNRAPPYPRSAPHGPEPPPPNKPSITSRLPLPPVRGRERPTRVERCVRIRLRPQLGAHPAPSRQAAPYDALAASCAQSSRLARAHLSGPAPRLPRPPPAKYRGPQAAPPIITPVARARPRPAFPVLALAHGVAPHTHGNAGGGGSARWASEGPRPTPHVHVRPQCASPRACSLPEFTRRKTDPRLTVRPTTSSASDAPP